MSWGRVIICKEPSSHNLGGNRSIERQRRHRQLDRSTNQHTAVRDSESQKTDVDGVMFCSPWTLPEDGTIDCHDDSGPKSNRTSADFTRCGFANRSIDSPNTSPTTRYVWSQFWGGTVARLFLAGDVQLTRCQRVGIAAWRCTIRSKYSRHRDVWIPQSSIRAVNGLNYLGSAHLPVGSGILLQYLHWVTGETRSCLPPRVIIIIIIIINVLIKVTLNERRCRGTLQSQWSTITDSTSRKAEESVNATDESRSSWYSSWNGTGGSSDDGGRWRQTRRSGMQY